MEMITKNFVQVYSNDDCEGRYYSWKDTDTTYEEVVAQLNNFWTGARVVKKIFNPETFEITYKVLKETNREYNWEKCEPEIIETIYTE